MTAGVYTEYLDLDGDGTVVFQGPHRLTDIPVILAHGATLETNGAFTLNQDQRYIPDLIVNGGGAGGPLMAAGIIGGGLAFGNNTEINAIESMVQALHVRYGTRTDKVAFYGGSMGGCALNWCWRNPDRVSYIALIVPLISLDDVHDDNEFDFGDRIDEAFDPAFFPEEDPGGYPVNGPAHDPFLNQEECAVFGDRIGMWCGVIDPLCEIAFARDFAANTGANLFEHPTGHDTLSFDVQDVVNWLVPRVLYMTPE